MDNHDSLYNVDLTDATLTRAKIDSVKNQFVAAYSNGVIKISNKNLSYIVANNILKILCLGDAKGKVDITRFLSYLNDTYSIKVSSTMFTGYTKGERDMPLVVMLAFCEFWNKGKVQEEQITMDTLLGLNANHVPLTKRPISWVDQNDLVQSEPEMKLTEIWIVLKDLFLEEVILRDNSSIFSNNLAHGVTYTYFVYKTDDNHASLQTIKTLAGDYSGQVSEVFISSNSTDKNYFYVPKYGYSFYNPDSVKLTADYAYEPHMFYGMNQYGGFRMHGDTIKLYLEKLRSCVHSLPILRTSICK